MSWLISVGDALSQLLGRFIWVRVDGQWVSWTASPNESISGAAHRWRKAGHFAWAEKSIDFLISPIERNHCEKAFRADFVRARLYIKAGEALL